MVMIRPRAGSFIWTEDELEIMEAEIAAARTLGLAGVVIGANLPDGRLDQSALQRLIKAADGLDIALHRSIDLTPDVVEAVEIAKQLGINRILSSGGAQKPYPVWKDWRRCRKQPETRSSSCRARASISTRYPQSLRPCQISPKSTRHAVRH